MVKKTDLRSIVLSVSSLRQQRSICPDRARSSEVTLDVRPTSLTGSVLDIRVSQKRTFLS